MAQMASTSTQKNDVLQDFKIICASLMEEFDESRGHQLALRDWSLLTNWVMQFVEEGKQIPDLMEEVMEQPTMAERITTIVSVDSLRQSMETASEDMIQACETREYKDILTTKLFNKLGNLFFEDKNYERSAEMYNTALLYCPQATELPADAPITHKNMFAMCFALRSRVFSITERYEQALADLDRAIKFCVDPGLTRCLFDAREDMIAEISEVCVDDSPDEPVPLLPEDAFNNTGLVGATTALQMAYKPKLGRHVIAKTPISKNTEIINEKAFAHWLAPSYYGIYCGHCMKPLNEQPFPCRFCIYLRFCSEECYDLAWDEYHVVECKYMPALKNFSNGHLALRMILTNGVDETLDAYYDVMAKAKFPIESKMVYRRRMKDILTLVSHEDLIDKVIPTGAFTAAFLTLFCRSLGIIDYDLVEDFGGLVLKLLAIIRVNSLQITDKAKSEDDADDFLSPRHTRSEIGAGLFGASSFVNHSCDHNCNRTFDGNRMIITTKRDIAAGEEITITYGPNKDRMGYKERQSYIMNRYFFKCACRACTARV